MFSLIKDGERSGMGLCDIYSWKEYGYEKPVIKETINPDRTTLTLNIEYEGNRDGNEGNRDGNVDGNRKANGYKEPEFVETVDPDRITLTL